MARLNPIDLLGMPGVDAARATVNDGGDCVVLHFHVHGRRFKLEIPKALAGRPSLLQRLSHRALLAHVGLLGENFGSPTVRVTWGQWLLFRVGLACMRLRMWLVRRRRP